MEHKYLLKLTLFHKITSIKESLSFENVTDMTSNKVGQLCGTVFESSRLVIGRVFVQFLVQTNHIPSILGQDANTL